MFALTRVQVTHFTHYPIYNFSIYRLFLSANCIGLHSVVNNLVDFEPIYRGTESRETHDFFIIIIIFCHYYYSANLQIQHYCLYSDSPTLLPLMMPRPPALSALRYLYITRTTINNNAPHLKSPKNQNRRAALGRPAMRLLEGFN